MRSGPPSGPVRRQALVVMGVAGSGKTTVARQLADHLGWVLAEADEFHTPANIAKMHAGHPLTDLDRWPWLRAIRDWITERAETGEDVVVTCSALKRRYRDVLREADAHVRFVLLTGDRDLLQMRIGHRSGHFMPASLLASQLADLEPLASDEDGVRVDVSHREEEVTAVALEALGLA